MIMFSQPALSSLNEIHGHAVFTSLSQEELSNQISSLIHSFQDADGRKLPICDFILM